MTTHETVSDLLYGSLGHAHVLLLPLTEPDVAGQSQRGDTCINTTTNQKASKRSCGVYSLPLQKGLSFQHLDKPQSLLPSNTGDSLQGK